MSIFYIILNKYKGNCNKKTIYITKMISKLIIVKIINSIYFYRYSK